MREVVFLERIAIISDIHGNIPALEAVLADIGQRGISRIICLGDMVGKGPNPDIAIDLVRDRCEVVLTGNWERGLLDRDSFPPEEAAVANWNFIKLGSARTSYIQSLPYCSEFLLSGKLVRLFHSSAKGIYHRVQQHHPEEERLAMFENTPSTGAAYDGRRPDLVGYGDIHQAYVQNFRGKTLFNCGSVGNPLEITQAAYAVIEGVTGSDFPAPWSVQLVRVPYDRERAIAQAMAEEGMPDREAYINEIQTAKYRGSK